MAVSSNFGFQNKTDSTHPVTPINLGVLDNYALVEDEPTSCVVSNTTCPIDQGELVSYKCQNVKNVSTSQDILYPGPVSAGVQYVVKVEEILSTASDTDPTFRVDVPIIAYLTIRHTKSGEVSDDVIGKVVNRLIGACQKSDGSWRFGDLMRSALKPTEN